MVRVGLEIGHVKNTTEAHSDHMGDRRRDEVEIDATARNVEPVLCGLGMVAQDNVDLHAIAP
jgi:hypothetical protein